MKRLNFLGLLFVIPSLLGCYNSTSIGTYEDADKYLAGNQTYDSLVTKINIGWTFGKVTLVRDTSIAGAKLEEENDLPDEEKVHSYLKGTELLVKFFASGHRAYNMNTKDKELVLTYNPNEITDFNISLTSGTLVAPTLVATNKVYLSFTSGVGIIEGIYAPDTNISLTSGNVTIDSLSVTNKALISATSGKVGIKDIFCNELDVDMTSGKVSLEFNTFKKSLIDMTSGDVNVKLPDDGAIVNIHKTSGSIKVDREHIVNGEKYTFGDSDSEMNIKITSGSVTVA